MYTVRDSSSKTTVEVTARFANPRVSKLVLGRNIRAMLICQPPLMRMKVGLQCCCRRMMLRPNFPIVNDIPDIESKDGITIGQLYDAARHLQAKHALCPYALSSHLDHEGIVGVQPTFRGRLELTPDDLLLRGDPNRKYEAMETLLTEYTDAKMHGRCGHTSRITVLYANSF